MSKTRECPSVEQLQQLASGLLPEPPAGMVEQHVLDCEPCAQATLNLVADETMVEAMRKAAAGAEVMDLGRPGIAEAGVGDVASISGATSQPERVGRLIAKLRELPTQAEDEASGATVLSGEAGLDAPPEIDWSTCFAPSESAEEIGRLSGFRVLSLLGHGGMGGVFLAEDMQLGRRVALKVMRPEFASRPGATERFLREAKAVAAVHDEHIVTIYQVGLATVPGQKQGVPFLAQELLHGEALDARLKRVGQLPVDEAVSIARQIAAGLAAAHERGLIHRDIKPANVFLQGSPVAPRQEAGLRDSAHLSMDRQLSQGAMAPITLPVAERQGYLKAKLLDFGLARSVDNAENLTQSGMILGTPAYMAPEQARGEAVDGRADLFSLGCVLYRMLTGQQAFGGKDVMATLMALATHEPPSPQSLRAEVPRELSDLAMRLLAKHRDARPESARDVVRQLTEIETSPVTRRVSKGVKDSDPTYFIPDSPTNVLPDSLADAAGYDSGHNTKRTGKSAHPTKRVVLALMGMAALALLAVVIVKIKTKDGKETEVTINVPGDVSAATVEVREGAGAKTTKATTKSAKANRVPNPAAASHAMDLSALVRSPAKLAGVESWTVETVTHRTPVVAIEFSPNAKWLATMDAIGQIRVWEVETGKLSRLLMDDAPINVYFNQRRLAWSHDSERLVCSHSSFDAESKSELAIWHLATGRLEHKIKSKGCMIGCGFLPEGRQIYSLHYTAGTDPGGMRTWDVATGEQLDERNLNTWSGAVSPDGKRVAFSSAMNRNVRVFEIDTWQQQWEYAIPKADFHTFGQHQLAWSPDGKTLALGPAQHGECVVRLLDGVTGQLKGESEDSLAANSLSLMFGQIAWSPDRKELAIGRWWGGPNSGCNTGGTQVIDATSGKFIRTGQGFSVKESNEGMTVGPAWSTDGKWLANDDGATGSVYLCDAATGERRRLLRGQGSSETKGLQWLTDDCSLSVGYQGDFPYGEVVWNTTTGFSSERQILNFGRYLTSPDGQRYLTLADDGFVLCDSQTKQTLSRLAHSEIGSGRVAWSANGKVIATATDHGGSSKVIKIWDADTGELRAELNNTNRAMAISLASDGSMLAAGGPHSDRVLILDAKSGEVRDTVVLGTGIWSVAYSPDDAALAVGASDGSIRIVSLRNPDAEKQVQPHTTLSQFAAHRRTVIALAWSRDGRTLATASNLRTDVRLSTDGIRLWSATNGEPQGELLILANDKALAVSAAGHYRGTPSDAVVRRDIVYVVQTTDGQLTLTPDEFEQRFGWKNDPTQVERPLQDIAE